VNKIHCQVDQGHDDTFYKNKDKNGGMPLNKIEKAKDDLNFGQK